MRLPCPKNANELLDMYFLDMRSALLEVAASLDRIQRAPGGEKVMEDDRLKKILHSLEILKEKSPGRAERFLLLFSEPSEEESK